MASLGHSSGKLITRDVALLVAEGLTDAEIAEKLGTTSTKVYLVVKDLQVTTGTREGIALVVLTTVLTDSERAGWVARAVYNRRRLRDEYVLDYTRACLMRRLAMPRYWSATVERLSAIEEIPVARVEYELSQLVNALGSRITVQVTGFLAPVTPLFWNRLLPPK